MALRTNEVSDPTASVVMPVAQMQGRAVWTDDGTRLGTIRHIHADDSGRIVAFDVRERWIFGPEHHVLADGMRMDQGDVIVPAAAAVASTRDMGRDPAPSTTPVAAPVLVAGREGARRRFGGLDAIGSLFGALAGIAVLAMLGSLLAAIVDTNLIQVDTAITTFDGVATDTLVVTGITILVAGLFGGWAAGRAARFDGAANGLLAVAWTVAFGLGFALLGRAAGDQYDVLAGSVVPRISVDDMAWAGALGFLAAALLMCVGAAVGGMLGEGWHRRADHAMLDVVPVGSAGSVARVDHGSAPGAPGSPVAPQPFVDPTSPPAGRLID